jgi:hypothetical protein
MDFQLREKSKLHYFKRIGQTKQLQEINKYSTPILIANSTAFPFDIGLNEVLYSYLVSACFLE